MDDAEMIQALGEVRDQLVRNSVGVDNRPVREVAAQERKLAKDSYYAVLSQMMLVVQSWVEGAKETHEANDHRGERTGSECWTQFAPEDIFNMINDAAREMGVEPVWKKGEQ